MACIIWKKLVNESSYSIDLNSSDSFLIISQATEPTIYFHDLSNSTCFSCAYHIINHNYLLNMYLPWLPIFLLHDFFCDIYSETSYRAGYKTLEILCLSIVGRELSPDFYHLLLAQELHM